MTAPTSNTGTFPTAVAASSATGNTGSNTSNMTHNNNTINTHNYTISSAIKMDELLVTHWLGGSDTVYTNVLEWIEQHSTSATTATTATTATSETTTTTSASIDSDKENAIRNVVADTNITTGTLSTDSSTININTTSNIIPPFYPIGQQMKVKRIIRTTSSNSISAATTSNTDGNATTTNLGIDTTNNINESNTNIDNNNVSRFNNSSTNNNNNINININANGGTNTTTMMTDSMYVYPYNFTSWDVPIHTTNSNTNGSTDIHQNIDTTQAQLPKCVYDVIVMVYYEYNPQQPNDTTLSKEQMTFSIDQFHRITKDVCHFPSYFNTPFYQRIVDVWNSRTLTSSSAETAFTADLVSVEMIEYYWKLYMEPYDMIDRFFYLIKPIQQNQRNTSSNTKSDIPPVIQSEYIVRDDFLPYIQALLREHPGLEFLSSHGEFQEKYAVTVITRIFYCVNTDHSGRITARQLRHSDLYDAFQQVDIEDDINKVTKYFSYEHFYVLYCRFWELDHDRDYKITREDLLKYGDHTLSHMIVDRIFDAAPRPFITYTNNSNNTNPIGETAAVTTTGSNKVNRDYLSYEDFIYFMLSEEDKSNEIAVRYWFTCVDVDGDGQLNNMEMRSFYAVQLHRMSCMGHETVPFEDMLCQMMDMMKPKNTSCLVVSDFLRKECRTVSGALFDALFSLNKYIQFEQRDPFNERQKREDEFATDWDRFACMDYNRLAMEEEAREEEAMEIDWVTVDDDDDVDDILVGENAAASNNSNNGIMGGTGDMQ